ncbi:MAG TPA: SMEK domain-containing protein [Verrucomicrobiales bacterium]|nr:SMEK domain-containing protein [Verrucomicrobiales bacterium]
MPFTRESLLKDIEVRLDDLSRRIKGHTGIGLNDAAKFLEPFAARLLNATYDWDLKDPAPGTPNTKGIDLTDDKRRVAVLVSVQESAEKIKHTKAMLSDGRFAGYQTVAIFFLHSIKYRDDHDLRIINIPTLIGDLTGKDISVLEKIIAILDDEIAILEPRGSARARQSTEVTEPALVRGPPPVSGKEKTSSGEAKRFRVAFSFAGDQREFVAKVANVLAGTFGREAIFYDKFHQAELAQPNLDLLLSKVYGEQSDLIVQVVSDDFESREWSGLDWRHMRAILMRSDSHRVMLGHFGHGGLPLSYGTGSLNLDEISPDQFATLILERLAVNEGLPSNHYIKDRPAEKGQEGGEAKGESERGAQSTEVTEPALVTGPPGFHPEFRSVGLDDKVVDYLEVEAEAVRLAELIALRETNLPLAVGLFGNWGSGKSHFMGLLRMHMLDRAKAARRGPEGAADGRWCREIVPIVFNAWHYLDSNLWASLVSEIFERLFARLQPKGDMLQQVQEKLREVGGTTARAEEEAARSQAAVTKASGELQTARREADHAQTVYSGMVDRLKELLPEFKKSASLERIAELLGVEPEVATLSALKKKNENLSSLPGQAKELWQKFKEPHGRAYRIGWLLAAVGIGPLLVWLVLKAMPGVEQWIRDAGGETSTAVAGGCAHGDFALFCPAPEAFARNA